MPVPHGVSEVKLRMEWVSTSKKWRLTWSLVDQAATVWCTHWRWIETDTAFEVMDAHRLADAIAREMESWLPW